MPKLRRASGRVTAIRRFHSGLLLPLLPLAAAVAAYWTARGRPTLLRPWLHGMDARAEPAAWAALALAATVVAIALIHALYPRALDLDLPFAPSWSGLGEDVESDGAVGPLLRMLAVALTIAVLLALAVAGYAALAIPRSSEPEPTQGSGEPTPPAPERGSERSQQPPPTADLSGIEVQLQALNTALLATQRTAAPDLSMLRASLDSFASIVSKLAEQPRPPPPPDLTGLQQSLDRISAALNRPAERPTPPPDFSSAQKSLGEISTGIGKLTERLAPSLDLSSLQKALAEISTAISKLPGQSSPPSDLSSLQPSLNAINATMNKLAERLTAPPDLSSLQKSLDGISATLGKLAAPPPPTPDLAWLRQSLESISTAVAKLQASRPEEAGRAELQKSLDAFGAAINKLAAQARPIRAPVLSGLQDLLKALATAAAQLPKDPVPALTLPGAEPALQKIQAALAPQRAYPAQPRRVPRNRHMGKTVRS